MYLSYLIFVICVWINLAQNILSLVWMTIWIVYILSRIKEEEFVLRNLFGDAHAEYAAATPVFFPCLALCNFGSVLPRDDPMSEVFIRQTAPLETEMRSTNPQNGPDSVDNDVDDGGNSSDESENRNRGDSVIPIRIDLDDADENRTRTHLF